MRSVLAVFLISLCCVVPALAGPWTMLPAVTLPAADSSVLLEFPTPDDQVKPVLVDKIRMSVQGATVVMQGLVLTPVQGRPILLDVSGQLKSGEASGLIQVPGMAVPVKSLRLHYRILQGRDALLTVRVSPR